MESDKFFFSWLICRGREGSDWGFFGEIGHLTHSFRSTPLLSKSHRWRFWLGFRTRFIRIYIYIYLYIYRHVQITHNVHVHILPSFLSKKNNPTTIGPKSQQKSPCSPRTKWRRLLQYVWVTWPRLSGVDRYKQLCRPSSSYGWKRVNRRTKKKRVHALVLVAFLLGWGWCLGFHWVISPMTVSNGVLIIDPLDLTVWFTLFFWRGGKTALLLRWVPKNVWVIFVGSSGTIFNMTTCFFGWFPIVEGAWIS